MWRTASAAAHGRNWYTHATHAVQVGEEYEPGYFRSVAVPDEAALVDVMTVAATLTFGVVSRYAVGLGEDPDELSRRALLEVARCSPLKPGGAELKAKLEAALATGDAVESATRDTGD